MARISSYVKTNPVVAADKWIGSDSTKSWQTKNFTAQTVANFINSYGGQAQNVRYRYNKTIDYETGTIAFTGGGADSVLLNSITTFNIGIHQTRSAVLSVEEYITNAFIGSDILITQCDDISNWAIYTWNTAVLLPSDLEYEIGLTYKAGDGSLTEDKEYFLSLLDYDISSSQDKTFVFVQGVPNTIWSIQHDLGKFPSVSVVNNNNVLMYGETTYIDNNNLTIEFSAGFSGKAYLN